MLVESSQFNPARRALFFECLREMRYSSERKVAAPLHILPLLDIELTAVLARIRLPVRSSEHAEGYTPRVSIWDAWKQANQGPSER